MKKQSPPVRLHTYPTSLLGSCGFFGLCLEAGKKKKTKDRCRVLFFGSFFFIFFPLMQQMHPGLPPFFFAKVLPSKIDRAIDRSIDQKKRVKKSSLPF